MGKSSRNKKRSMENVSLLYQDIEPSLSAGDHLTQEEATKEALAIRISQKFALLEEVELDGKIVKKEEEAVKRIKGEALKEKEDPGAFIFPIRLEGKVNKNALADTRSDINTMAYRIYETLGREEMKKVERGITKINHTQAEAMGILTNTMKTHDDEAESSRSKRSRQHETVKEVLIIKFRLGRRAHSLTLLEFAHRLGLYQATELDEEGFNIYFEGDDVLRSLSALVYCRDLDKTTLKELIDSESRLIPEDQ
nr:hypothetical protein [Tanacetum cinerariifolium]